MADSLGTALIAIRVDWLLSKVGHLRNALRLHMGLSCSSCCRVVGKDVQIVVEGRLIIVLYDTWLVDRPRMSLCWWGSHLVMIHEGLSCLCTGICSLIHTITSSISIGVGWVRIQVVRTNLRWRLKFIRSHLFWRPWVVLRQGWLWMVLYAMLVWLMFSRRGDSLLKALRLV